MNTIIIFSANVYPFGGGERALLEFISGLRKVFSLPMNIYWYGVGSLTGVVRDIDDIVVRIIENNTQQEYQKIIVKHNPFIVLTYGEYTHLVGKACSQTNTHFICFWHYWDNAITLGKTSNIDMFKKMVMHKPSPHFDSIINCIGSDGERLCLPVVNSVFTQSVIEKVTGFTIPHISIPYTPSHTYPPYTTLRNKVICLNINPYKGGLVFRHFAKRNPNIECIGIKIEPFVEEHTFRDISNLKIVSWQDNVNELYNQAKLVIATSLVDETFCRVVMECINYGVPVVTTRNGNIPNLLGNDKDVLYITPPSISSPPTSYITISTYIRQCYDNNALLMRYSNYLSQRYKTIVCQNMTQEHMIYDLILQKKVGLKMSINIMFFCPWFEQGLGYQCLEYVKYLRQINNVTTHIFSFSPCNPSLSKRSDPETWYHSSIYQSTARESVSDAELIDFVSKRSIDICIVPEISRGRTLSLPELLQPLGCRVVAIPNIELLPKDLVCSLNKFDKVLCNNLSTYNILQRSVSGESLKLVGYQPFFIALEPRQPYKKLTFVWFGGTCPGGRKQLSLLLKALEPLSGCELFNVVICLQTYDAEIKESIKYYKCCDYKFGSLTDRQVKTLLRNSDMTIIITQHEGLGLGLYDAVQQQTPVMTYDTTPHNEVVPKECGVWIKPTYIPPTDMPDSMVQSVTCSPELLRQHILQVVFEGREFTDTLQKNYMNYPADMSYGSRLYKAMVEK